VVEMTVPAHLLSRHRPKMLARRVAAVSFAAAVTVPILSLPAFAASGFTSGDVVVYRVGTGAAALSSTSVAVTLDEYLPAVQNQSAPALSLPMPIATGTGTTPNPLSASGNATSEGGLTLSTDGSTLLVPGYDAAPGVTGIASTTAANDPREVAEVNNAGTIDTTTTLGTSAFSGNNIRSAAAATGFSSTAGVWAGGAGGTEASQGGVWYTTDGASTSTMLIGGNFRWVNIFNQQLYSSSASATSPAVIGVNQVGSGLPTIAGQALTNLNGVDSSSSGTPYEYYLLSEGGNGIDTAYVADTTVGIEKYSLIAGTWTAEGSIAMAGVTGLTGSVNAGTVTLYATDPTNLVSATDTVGTGTLSGALTTLATAATDEAFRGVAFAPSAPPPALPEAPLTIALPILALGLVGGTVTLTTLRRRRRIIA
jgi:hypothetical protein